MAMYEVSLNSEQLSGLLTSDKGLQGLVETVLNWVLEAQVTDQIGALPYGRGEQCPQRDFIKTSFSSYLAVYLEPYRAPIS